MEYCYIITFIPTGQMYIGSRTAADACTEEFWNKFHRTGYFTSSKIIHGLIDEYGIDSFRVDKILTFPDGGAYEYETTTLRTNDLANHSSWLNESNNFAKKNNNSTGKMWINNGLKEIYVKLNSNLLPGYTKGRLKWNEKRKSGTNIGNKWMNNPETLKNIHVSIDKIEYYKSLGYVMGQTNSASLLTWYTDGKTNLYLKEPPKDSIWYQSRTIDQSHQLVTIIDPNGIIHSGLASFYRFMKEKTNCRLKIGTYARNIIAGKKTIITKKLYKNNEPLFSLYNLDCTIIGKCFTEIGFIFNKSQKS